VTRGGTSRPWLALFSLIALTQTAHLLEHVAQIVQIHLLGVRGAAARGIVGQLDLEWVHFIWNTAVVVVLALLLLRYRDNRWLVVATAIASWHLIEHDVIMQTFLVTGIPGSPGLLASGGLIAGGLPIARPDLHFLYNLVETAAIVWALLTHLRTSVVLAQRRPPGTAQQTPATIARA
jgi:hypothetical protein